MPSPRRRFLTSLSAVPLLPGALVRSQATPSPRPPESSPSPAPTETDRVAEALTEVVKRRYGAHLEATDSEDIQKGIVSNLKGADRVRSSRTLGNADEPVTAFQARPPGTEPKEKRKW